LVPPSAAGDEKTTLRLGVLKNQRPLSGSSRSSASRVFLPEGPRIRKSSFDFFGLHGVEISHSRPFRSCWIAAKCKELFFPARRGNSGSKKATVAAVGLIFWSVIHMLEDDPGSASLSPRALQGTGTSRDRQMCLFLVVREGSYKKKMPRLALLGRRYCRLCSNIKPVVHHGYGDGHARGKSVLLADEFIVRAVDGAKVDIRLIIASALR